MKPGPETRCVSIRAPAKINLGLEIIGRRPDGFHEIRSVLAMIDVCDYLTFDFDLVGAPPAIDGVVAGQNLIDRAIRELQLRVGNAVTPVHYAIEKRIPVAAGLGGASADAAATLVAVNQLHGHPLSQDQLIEIGASLGSDVPFFLGSPTALVQGTGTKTSPVRVLSGSILLIVPNVEIPEKTATLYSLIAERDFSSGRGVERTVRRLDVGLAPDPNDLKNAFMKPLYRLLPDLAALPRILHDAGCTVYGLSGAGPTHYALVDRSRIAAIAARLRSLLDMQRFRIVETSFLTEGINPTLPRSIGPLS